MTLDISILASMDITVLLTICMRHQIYFKETNGKLTVWNCFVMNSTYIHLRASGSYIYMYRRGRIYKEPPGEIHI
jgi:hypothetical protein